MSKPNTYDLDYLFLAESVNGNIIKQTPEDISRIHPMKNAFYDVLQNLPLKKFSLVGKGHIFSIDFKDLHFEMDGRVVPTKKLPPHDAKISLIYWRDVIQTQKQTLQQEQSLISRIVHRFLEVVPMGATVRYRIGWEAHKNGLRCGSEIMTIV